MSHDQIYDAVVVGGGPAGATAAADLARHGHAVLLLDKAGRIKPCGGAIPPKLIDDFAIPDALLKAKITCARMISPSDRRVDMPIEGGFVGMVDRCAFDEWLRQRAEILGATRAAGQFLRLEHDAHGVTVHYRAKPCADGDVATAPYSASSEATRATESEARAATCSVRAKVVIGADGANSAVAKQAVPGGDATPFVFAYHEIVEAPQDGVADYTPERCDVVYRGALSPDFYSWVFPHGDTVSVGTGSAHKGFSLRGATQELRAATGLAEVRTVRREGAPIPLKPLARWDNGRDVIVVGDAAGVVAPSSGEGIYYAMLSGRLAADAVAEALRTGKATALARARQRFMRTHGGVFWILGQMQRYWYTNDQRRERFVSICRDVDVQQLTFDAYMNKELVKARPLAHVRILAKNIAHLTGAVSPA